MLKYSALLLILIPTVMAGMGQLNCNANLCNLELYVYSDNSSYVTRFMEQVRISSEIMCTFQNIRITKITHVNNKSNLGYSDIIIYDQTYEGIIFPFTSESNINEYGYYNGINQGQLTDINIANTILKFLGYSNVTREKRCFDGNEYGIICQNSSQCANLETCSIAYPENLRQKSRSTCHRSLAIQEVPVPANRGVHLVFDRSIYNHQYNMTATVIHQMRSYFGEYSVNLKNVDYFPRLTHIVPKCKFFSKTKYVDQGNVCINNFYSEYNLNLSNGYHREYYGRFSTDTCTIKWHNCCSRGWHAHYVGHHSFCAYACETHSQFNNDCIQNPENYPPNDQYDISQNIEQSIKNYYLSDTSIYDHMVYVTNGKFMMETIEFDQFINQISMFPKKLIVFAISDGPISDQLYKLVRITHGELYFVDASLTEEIMKIKSQKEILKMIANIQKKKILNDDVNQPWFDMHFYSQINQVKINILGTHDPVIITDNRGIRYTPIVNRVTGTTSQVHTIANPLPGIWRAQISGSSYYETIVMVDDVYYTGYSQKTNHFVEIFPTRRMSGDMSAEIYNVSNNAYLGRVTANRTYNGTYLIPTYDQEQAQRIQILDVIFVNEPIIYVAPKLFCNYVCQLLRESIHSPQDQANTPTPTPTLNSSSLSQPDDGYHHYIDDEQTCDPNIPNSATSYSIGIFVVLVMITSVLI